MDSLASSVAGAPALEIIGSGTSFASEQPSGADDRVFRFPEGSGLKLPNAGSVVGTSYTIVILLRSEYLPNTVDREAKIVDWHDGMSETGLSFDCNFMCNDGQFDHHGRASNPGPALRPTRGPSS